MTHDQMLTAGIAVFSVMAGIAWLRSATSQVRVPDEHGKPVEFRMTTGDEPDDNQVIVKGVDVWRTMALQSKWNTLAAAAACAAALIQGSQAALNWLGLLR